MIDLLTTVCVLTSIFTSHLNSVEGQSTCCPVGSCCDDSCDAPHGINITLDEVIAMQPIYVTFLPNVPLFAGVDNSCYTFIPLPDGNNLLIISTVYSNGLNTIETYVITFVSPGVADYGSATCNQEITSFLMLSEGATCNMLITYLCFRYGECPLDAGDGTLPIMGLSPIAEGIDDDCLTAAVSAISRAGFPSQEYFALPMQRDAQCVTEIPCNIGY